jgi:hypothetical protein
MAFVCIACESNDKFIIDDKPLTESWLALRNKALEGDSWREIHKEYMNNFAHLHNEELINQIIFLLSNEQLRFFEDADIKTYEFYLREAEKIEFNRNLRLIVRLIDKVKPEWNNFQIASYSKRMYEKNTMFWNNNFPNQTIYLEKNEQALAALIRNQETLN